MCRTRRELSAPALPFLRAVSPCGGIAAALTFLIEHELTGEKMEFAKIELEMVGQVTAEAHQGDVNQLSELQLVLVGGGIADVVLA